MERSMCVIKNHKLIKKNYCIVSRKKKRKRAKQKGEKKIYKKK